MKPKDDWLHRIIGWVKAEDITPEMWDLVKRKFPSKHKKLFRDIDSFGLNKVKVGFSNFEDWKPEGVSISLE